MNDPDHDRIREGLAAHVLGALGPEEESAVNRHLAACDRCRDEVRWFEPVLATLPACVERLEPRPQLRRRLMSEVRRDAVNAQAVRNPRLSRLRSAPQHWSPFRRAAVAGILVLLVITTAGAIREISDGTDGNGGTVAFVSGEAPGVIATVVRDGDVGRLAMANVPSLPPDRVLEAWVRRSGELEPVASLFVPNGNGRAAASLGDLRSVDAVIVTTEPPGGSRAPTSAAIAAVSIPIKGQ